MNTTNTPGISAPHEHCFLSTINSVSRTHTDLTPVLAELDQWQSSLEQNLASLQWPLSGLHDDSDFVMQVNAINQTLQGLSPHWEFQRSELSHAREISDLLEEKVILLVFGKFNVGKSAFCNFLAQRFSAWGETVQYFYLENGAIIETDKAFAEGETETTARLQGVCLGRQLVILDTPGLHSVTAQNAELTKRFIESADGLLWLSSSASPGQTQELDELSNELHRGKPLMPVLTRSDVFEEDEVDGEIQKLLRNKTPDNRHLQEKDVSERARIKLDAMQLGPDLLVSPVSVSTYMARSEGLTPQALMDAGFENLYASLLDIVQPALAYKQRKPAEMVLHHLEENVLGALHTTLAPQLRHLHSTVVEAQEAMAHVPDQILSAMWRKIAPGLPALLDKYLPSGNVQALCSAVNLLANNALREVISVVIPDYVINSREFSVLLPLNDDAVTTDYERLYTMLKEVLHTYLEAIATDLVTPCQNALNLLDAFITDTQLFIKSHEESLKDLKIRLRHRSV